MIHHPHYRSGVLLLAMVLMVFSSCNDHHQTGAAGSNRVVVIFQDCRDQTVASRFGGTISTAGEKTISYVDAAGYQVKYSPRSIGYDTLIIPTYCGYAELMHLYAVEEPIFWLLMEGDTVLVTVGDKGRPQLSSFNQENTWLYNLPWHDSRAVHANGYSLKTILDNPYFQRIDIYMKDPEQQRKAPSIMKKLAPEYVNLDSLRVVYEAYIKDFSDSLAVWEATDRIPKKYADLYRILLEYYLMDELEEWREIYGNTVLPELYEHAFGAPPYRRSRRKKGTGSDVDGHVWYTGEIPQTTSDVDRIDESGRTGQLPQAKPLLW